jgi:hypothetical protein
MGMTKQNMPPETESLRKVTVRLIVPQERDCFDELLERKHYLHCARLEGKAFVMWLKSMGNGWL